MAPKRVSKVSAKEPGSKELLTSVDKAFYELELQAIRNKIERLQNFNAEKEKQNVELVESNAKREEERAENISAVKNMLLQKEEDVQALTDHLEELRALQAEERIFYSQQLFEMEAVVSKKREAIVAEIKEVQGKLNSLEEFRVQKDELVKQYEKQVDEMEKAETAHNREIYQIEKKFLKSKDHLKREMIERLVTLSMQFQDVTDTRVADTTHRTIRENIAINNDLNMLVETEVNLKSESEAFINRAKFFKRSMRVYEETKVESAFKWITQRDIIQEVSNKHAKVTEEAKNYEVVDEACGFYEQELKELEHAAEKERMAVQILEQNFQNVRTNNELNETRYQEIKHRTKSLLQTILHITHKIREEWITPFELFRQHGFLDVEDDLTLPEKQANLINFILEEIEKFPVCKCLLYQNSIVSCANFYQEGELGTTPKYVEPRSEYPVRRHVGTQVTQEDVQEHVEPDSNEIEEEEIIEEEEEEEPELDEEMSQVLFSASQSEISSCSSRNSLRDFTKVQIEEAAVECESEEEITPALNESPSTTTESSYSGVSSASSSTD
ncbi:LOW QUALITY PROTEIN: cilia- and flagella-associated protein 157 [Atheta coriaria]|uniref:LOW QUALITY PROTEIN: cilia- and flagella-associated protein 157 n=1 Tax=Dalotia coriaria TaxID=877792 RepID=UPI0031F45DAC